MAYFILGYFSMKLGKSVDGHEQIIIWKFHWNCPRNKRWRANIMANVQKNVILHYKNFYFGKICAETCSSLKQLDEVIHFLLQFTKQLICWHVPLPCPYCHHFSLQMLSIPTWGSADYHF
jgi:hypothetical protein